jgi:hypothetical protein
MILPLTKSCGVSDPAEQSSARYHTPGNNFKYEYFRKFETEFKKILGCEFGDYMGSIHGENQRSKISCYWPCNRISTAIAHTHVPCITYLDKNVVKKIHFYVEKKPFENYQNIIAEHYTSTNNSCYWPTKRETSLGQTIPVQIHCVWGQNIPSFTTHSPLVNLTGRRALLWHLYLYSDVLVLSA